MAKNTTVRGGGKASAPAIKQNERVEIRAISNGFIVAKSGVDSKGNYKSTEMFSKTNPIKVR